MATWYGEARPGEFRAVKGDRLFARQEAAGELATVFRGVPCAADAEAARERGWDALADHIDAAKALEDDAAAEEEARAQRKAEAIALVKERLEARAKARAKEAKALADAKAAVRARAAAAAEVPKLVEEGDG